MVNHLFGRRDLMMKVDDMATGMRKEKMGCDRERIE
jgi:hypothetical protein